MAQRAAYLLLAIVLTACGSDDPNPGPRMDLGAYGDSFSNSCPLCEGCCQNGQCMPGTMTTACGIGGLPCHACFTGQSCINGTCINQTSTCSTSCNGCCTSTGTCINPGTTANCGISGLPCTSCTAEQTCEGGACRSTAPSIITVAVVSAEVSNEDCSEIWGSWDDDCDPFVKFKLGNGVEVISSWIEDTESPVWDDAKMDVDRARLLSETLHVEVWDDDYEHDELGRCDLTITEAHLTAGELVTDCGKGEIVTRNLKITFTAASN
ncbi:MAG: hypothetical protein JRH20_14030 [Deltaproteobacteria bacterium]|nr:hypothetical protein [Deltaproteobacteria bacterium]